MERKRGTGARTGGRKWVCVAARKSSLSNSGGQSYTLPDPASYAVRIPTESHILPACSSVPSRRSEGRPVRLALKRLDSRCATSKQSSHSRPLFVDEGYASVWHQFPSSTGYGTVLWSPEVSTRGWSGSEAGKGTREGPPPSPFETGAHKDQTYLTSARSHPRPTPGPLPPVYPFAA